MREPPFIAESDEMVGVEALDELADLCGPLCDDGCRAAVATALVAKFPGEDGGRALVAVDDELNPVSIGGLAGRVGVEGGSITAECGTIGIDTALYSIRKWWIERRGDNRARDRPNY